MKVRICPNCNIVNPGETGDCFHCGAPLSATLTIEAQDQSREKFDWIEILQSGAEPAAKRDAINALAHWGETDPDIRIILRRVARTAEDSVVRDAANEAYRSLKPDAVRRPRPVETDQTAPAPRAEADDPAVEISRQSLAGRALQAVVLTICFYGLALLIVGILIYLPYAMIVYGNRINVRLFLFCLVGVVTILYSIMPRRGRFEPPGPALTEQDHPALFEHIQAIAQKTGQAMPEKTFLMMMPNAFVAELGGFLGWGGKRIMGLGLPLMQTLTISQLEAVLAHEFGHFHAGDTKLGPWVYKTREAIIRTVSNLRSSAILQAPFGWYARMFLRLTNAVSRQQEFTADELAGKTVGKKAMIDGLHTVHDVSNAFPIFWQREVAPLLEAGYYAPISTGFSQFMSADMIAELLERQTEAELASGKSNPYDTHPSLRERVLALERLPDNGAAYTGQRALDLITNPQEMEIRIIKQLLKDKKFQELEHINWDTAAETVRIPGWQETAARFSSELAPFTAGDIPHMIRNPPATLSKKLKPTGDPLPAQLIRQAWVSITRSALSCALLEAGWTLESSLGELNTFLKGEQRFHPFTEISKLLEQESSAEDWADLTYELEITDLPLGPGKSPR